MSIRGRQHHAVVVHDGPENGPSLLADYVMHPPIEITSDEDFALQGWPGSGTPEDPYLIQGLAINSTETCISIKNTRVSFVIRDCFLIPSPGPASFVTGVGLTNVTQGEIRNCTLLNLGAAIVATACNRTNIVGNRIDGCFEGLSLFNIVGPSAVANNTISTDLWTIIGVVSNVRFVGNTIDARYTPFMAFDSVNCTFTDNIVRSSFPSGLELSTCTDWTIENNVFENGGLGIMSRTVVPSFRINNNTLNGRPIGYFEDLSDQSLDVTGYGLSLIHI